jgi:uncharacterized SAM-binding protein YcdF (DUF218 family)
MALLVFVLFLGAIYVVRHPLLRLAGSFWVVEDPLENADAIIVLGDDNFAGDRATRASQLFRAGRAPLIVASGRLLRPYVGVAEFIERDLQSRGVPASAILRFPQTAASTREEAEALRALAKERGWRRVTVVTSTYHTRRARYILRKVFPSTVAINMVAAWDSDFDPNSWWQSRRGVKTFVLESLSFCVALWEMRQNGR